MRCRLSYTALLRIGDSNPTFPDPVECSTCQPLAAVRIAKAHSGLIRMWTDPPMARAGRGQGEAKDRCRPLVSTSSKHVIMEANRIFLLH